MSTLKERIQEDVKTAMRAKAQERLDILRLITAAIKQKEVDERGIEMNDAAVLAVLDKMVKQRRDSIEQFEKAQRMDLVKQEQYELELIQAYLPTPLSAAELESLIQDAIAQSGATSAKEMGKVMAILKPLVQGRSDVGAVSAAVKSKLGG